jgi:hypothetical protein
MAHVLMLAILSIDNQYTYTVVVILLPNSLALFIESVN